MIQIKHMSLSRDLTISLCFWNFLFNPYNILKLPINSRKFLAFLTLNFPQSGIPSLKLIKNNRSFSVSFNGFHLTNCSRVRSKSS